VQIKFVFEEPPSYMWKALDCARLMCDLQHLCLFAMYLVDDNVLTEYDVFSPRAQEYKYMIEADMEDAGPLRLNFYALNLWSLDYHSPPVITGGMGHHVPPSKFRAILQALKSVIFFEQHRRKLEAEAEKIRAEAEISRQKAEVARQKAICEAINNMEHILKISSKIKDPVQRQLFIDNMTWAIKPFTDGSHPMIRDIEVD
jgi:hypothetical protein